MKFGLSHGSGRLSKILATMAMVLGALLLTVIPVHSAPVLFVVGNTTLNVGDAAMRDLLQTTLGHTVTIRQAAAATSGDATGMSLVLVSSTVASPDVADKFNTVTVPVIVWEPAVYDDMRMVATATSYGTVALTTVTIVNGSHPIAAGLTGSPAFYTASTGGAAYGIIAGAGVQVASVPGVPTQSAIFAFETGVAMATGTAPARRVGFALGDATISALTASGQSMLRAAINWSMNISAPAITTQPANRSVVVGATAAFSVVATGSGLTYQWRKNGTNISGATSASYTTPATVTADNGALFSVVVTNTAGNVTSANATLTVTSGGTAPAITTQPGNQTVTTGQTAAFSVVASGTAPLTYQWRKNGTNISGATSASYTTPATVSADNGALFSVVVSNSLGNATSNNATLTVTASPTPPSITTQPANQSVTVGATAGFSVVASGTAPLTYQWRKNGTNISGATSASYTTPATVSADNGALFSVVVSNSAGNATSSNATLTVSSGGSTPVLAPLATPVIAVLGATASFTVTTTGGSTPFTYQWRKNGTNISGATAATYVTPATAFGDNGAVFTCVVTNSAGNATSTGATLQIELVTSRITATRITATELVTSPQWEIPDYVFEKGYNLRTLPELEKYLQTHKHLPEVPAASEIKNRGMDVGLMNVTMLKNLEELTLHVIALQKEMAEKDIRMERQLDSLRSLLKSDSR